MGAAVLAVVGARAAVAPKTDRHGARIVRFVVDGRKQTGVIPAGLAPGERRPLLVFLHGRGGSATSHLNGDFFAALAARRSRAPVVLFPEGGDHSYWHDRRGGRWATYLLRDVVPAARRRLPVDPDRTALGGISMGGFGALDAARRHRGMFCAVGAHSPALWQRANETAPGAFDGAADFARHDVVGAARRSPRSFAGAPLWVDSGTSDPFNPGIRAFVAALRRGGVAVRVRHWPGGHADSYWRAHWGSYLRFYSGALARC